MFSIQVTLFGILHWFPLWFASASVLNHYPNQRWLIVDWVLGIKIKLDFRQDMNIFVQQNAFENVECKMSVNLFSPHCINILCSDIYLFYISGEYFFAMNRPSDKSLPIFI